VSRIFISYRRSDASADAGRLRDRLAERFGDALIFQDVNRINPGQRFAAVIDEALASCDVFLAIIGPAWLDCRNPDGARRLDLPQDWVRVETAKALAREGVTVIPVRVRGAPLPAKAALPDDLQPLRDLEDCELTDRKWLRDVEDLIRLLEVELKIPARPAPPEILRRRRIKKSLVIAAGTVFGLIALAAAGLFDTEVPDVAGKPLAQAQAELRQKLGRDADVSEEDNDAPFGQVIWQGPPPGGYLNVGDLHLGVSRRRPDVQPWTSIREAKAENSGAGMAMATAMETSLAFQGRPAAVSARYLIEKSKQMGDTAAGATGTYLTAVTNVAQRFGAPSEESWPYQDNQPALPSGTTWSALDEQAGARKVRVIRLASYEEIADHLRHGRPVIAAVDVYQDGWGLKGDFVRAVTPTGPLFGRHSIVIVGFNLPNKIDGIRFANVWGKRWGDRGYADMSETDAKTMLDLRDMWAVEVLPAGNPVAEGR
jgi:hypothetical protein